VRPGAASYLHQDASASSLGLARVLVFSIWFYQLAVDPVERLAELPSSALAPPGVLRVVPYRLWDLVLDPSVLLVFKIGLLIGLAVVILGLTHSRLVLGLTAGALVFYQSLVRGFSGHMNHAELGLLFVSLLFVFFPVFDGLTLRPPRSIRPETNKADSRTDSMASYVMAMLSASLILVLTYFFVGCVRIWKGIDVFSTPALRDYIAEHALQGGQFDGSSILALGLPASVLGLPLWVFQLAFVLATVLELSTPLALFSRSFRPVIVVGLLLFHVSIWAFMNVPFPENMCLLALLSGTWFHRVAARIDRPHRTLSALRPPV
jgi:hypothetical protein